jgi:hypothetical protein
LRNTNTSNIVTIQAPYPCRYPTVLVGREKLMYLHIQCIYQYSIP